MTGRISIRQIRTMAVVMAVTLALPSCVSFGGTAPASMLTLTSTASVTAGTSNSGLAKEAMIVLVPEVPRKLDTNRVPVQIDSGNVAYLKESVWTDKPAVLMQQLLIETLAAKNGMLILSEVEAAGKAENYLSGQLIEFGIDEGGSEAVAIFDAVRIRKGQPVEKRRFDARAGLNKIAPREAGEALNMVANKIADDVAAWLGTP
ncbi:MAG TPA: ABC-type transport auxiliary lipoprotein family protein [Sphingorhabdus sp.]|jgi:cholesterol transport system auxiliary component|uniref:ABC-type transport auxiliary lipoprotein family protein n=1 Tax=Sphingorhabdus sp. TaxID=1902408 RepID=UPI002C6B66BB|nr:ABC-type transport auxiliary lipoprotein family protein [Sphingorhabdus sp.]HMT40511.1 ABC-type transport auxiliary lipoprotein family protein [Sphingorhabdus sp.]HMU21515.1 ABC-type transport auxiliary lipoprotein family protein [Sphingorhabdus sp.]